MVPLHAWAVQGHGKLTVRDRTEIFENVNQLTGRGAAVLKISSELEEVIGFCDRVAVMRDGSIVRTLERDEIERERVIELAVGGN